MALHLHIESLKTALDSLYRDANPVPTSSLVNDIATAPSSEREECVVALHLPIGSLTKQYTLYCISFHLVCEKCENKFQ